MERLVEISGKLSESPDSGSVFVSQLELPGVWPENCWLRSPTQTSEAGRTRSSRDSLKVRISRSLGWRNREAAWRRSRWRVRRCVAAEFCVRSCEVLLIQLASDMCTADQFCSLDCGRNCRFLVNGAWADEPREKVQETCRFWNWGISRVNF